MQSSIYRMRRKVLMILLSAFVFSSGCSESNVATKPEKFAPKPEPGTFEIN